MLSYFVLKTVDGVNYLSTTYSIVSEKEITAYGAGSGSGGGSGSGIIETVYGSAGLGGSYLDNDLTNTFNAYTINLINTNLTGALGRIGALETRTPNVAWGTATSQYSPLTINSVARNLSVDGHTHSYLPLSGGELTRYLSINTPNSGGSSYIAFKRNNVDVGYIGDGASGPNTGIAVHNYISGKSLSLDNDGILRYSRNTIWHAGNDGAGSGLDADTIDGLHSSSFFKVVLNNQTSVNDYTFWENSAGKLYNNPDAPYNYYSFLSFGQGIYQTQFNGYNNSLKFRSGSESGLTNKSWRTVAFEDSNVASATYSPNSSKLYSTDETYKYSGIAPYYGYITHNNGLNVWDFKVSPSSPENVRVYMSDRLTNTRTIWGQSFNGEGNVSGSMYGVRSINNDVIDYMTTGGQYFYTMSNNQYPLLSLTSNVGIGTTSPQYKLDVNGSTRVNGYFRVSNDCISAGEYEDNGYGFINVCRTASIENASYFSMVRAGTAAFGIGLSTDNAIIIGVAAGDKTINNIHLKLNSDYVTTNKPLSSSSRIFTGYDSGIINSFSCSNWFRSNGATGWYNDTYGAGINSDTANVVRTYGTNMFKVYNTDGASIITLGGVYAYNWFRSNGASGWYNDTYGGGIYMTDTTYVKVSHNKSFWVNGNIVATGEVTAYSASDVRLKTEVTTLRDSLRIIELLNPVSYKWNSLAKELNPLKSDNKDFGLIAQELELVVPELVHDIYGG